MGLIENTKCVYKYADMTERIYMNKRQVGLYTIVPLLVTAIGCTYFNRPKTDKDIETKDSTVVQNDTLKYDIFDQYEHAKEAYAKGIMSADSFSAIQKKFEEEMKYVECGD